MVLDRDAGSTDDVTVTGMSSDRDTLGCIGFEHIEISPVDRANGLLCTRNSGGGSTCGSKIGTESCADSSACGAGCDHGSGFGALVHLCTPSDGILGTRGGPGEHVRGVRAALRAKEGTPRDPAPEF